MACERRLDVFVEPSRGAEQGQHPCNLRRAADTGVIRSAAIQLPQKYSFTASCMTLGPPVPVYVFEYSPK